MTEESAATEAVEFVAPPPGLHPHASFRLSRIAGAPDLYALRSADETVRLFVLDPLSVGHAYPPRTLAGARAAVGADAQDEVRVLVVANPAEHGVCVNLRAPIVVHRGTGRATQAILEDQELPLQLLLGD